MSNFYAVMVIVNGLGLELNMMQHNYTYAAFNVLGAFVALVGVFHE